MWRACPEFRRHNEVKEAQVGRNIVGKSVRSDPAAQVHSQSGEFFFARRSAHPNTMLLSQALSHDSKIRRRLNHDFLELLHIPANVPAMIRQVQDRISDDLAGAVIRNVASPVRGMKLHAHLAST